MNSKKKILFIQNYHPNVYHTLKSLSKVADVTLLSIGQRKVPAEFKSIKIKSRIINSLFFPNIFQLWKNIKKNYDFVVLKEINVPSTFLAMFFCKLKGLKFIVNVQKIKHLKNPLYQLAYPIVKFLLIPKRTMIYASVKEGYITGKKELKNVHYIPCPIESSKTKSFKTSSTLNILCIGKFNEKRKNHILLIEALNQLQEKYPKIKFNLSIAGALSYKNAYYDAVMKKINSAKIDIKIHKNVAHKDMEKLFLKSDLYIVPSNNEPASYSNLEAMSYGIPVILSSDNGTKCYTSHGKDGFIFKKDSLESLSNSIESFISGGKINFKKLIFFGKNAKTKVLKEHSPETFLKRFLPLLR